MRNMNLTGMYFSERILDVNVFMLKIDLFTLLLIKQPFYSTKLNE